VTPGSDDGGSDGDFDLRRVVAALVERCDRVVAENEELKAENQELRDEIARLKGLPPRPKFKAQSSGM
jgi:cell division protein FtsB